MSLPPTFLDELRARLTLSDVVGRKVLWDKRKSNPGKGDFWAPCPFHQEKTPSFHVDDRKGFYYCFGCQAKGDLITFVKETENVEFMEAVEILAREAGLEMPKREADPRAAEKRDRLTRLFDVMEDAVRQFGLAFRAGMGQPARDYAAGRGLAAETLKRFEIGYAPDNRTYLAQHFREKGQIEEAVAAGLVIAPEDGGAPYDRFRGRLMFPIRDPRGRCIAFGARALLPTQQAKYLNSPETELFHKGRTLYNHGPAREAAGKSGRLIVAEGYMDVIALAAAGFENAVAPLGTAITEEQLQLLWRTAPEPVIALDGDEAGLRAAHKVMDLALPMLAPGRSLRFCLMPPGQDPDELIRAEGPSGMRAALDAALPLVEMLWRREVDAVPLDTPEARAGFDRRLREALGRIAEPGVREHYMAEIRSRRAELFRPARPGPARGQGGAPRAGRRRDGAVRFVDLGGPQSATKNSDLARPGTEAGRVGARIREAAILLIAWRNAAALGPLEAEIETMAITTPEFEPVRETLLSALAGAEQGAADPLAPILARLGADPSEALVRVPQARGHPCARSGMAPERVREVLVEAIRRHASALAFEAEFAEARRELGQSEDERWTHRMRRASAELQRLEREIMGGDPVPGEDRPSPIQAMLDAEVYRAKKP